MSIRDRDFRVWAVGALLALFVAAAANSLVRESATFDETAHLPAGFTYLDQRDFRLNTEHPPLFKAWAALPLWLADLAEPDYASRAWTGSRVEGVEQRTKASEWKFGYEFLNRSPSRPPSRLLIPARLAMIVPGLLLGLIVYAWARELWGRDAALLALFLYCLSPTMLAHTRLVTTDLPTALGYAATLWTFWRLCRQPGWTRAVLFGLAFAGALLVKFSALLLAPTLGLLSVVWVLAPGEPDQSRRARIRWVGIAALAAMLIGYAGIWAGYTFRFAAAADPAYSLDWEVVGLSQGMAAELVRFGLAHRLLPESYLYGIAFFLGGAARRLAFLNGQQSIIGWWYYFPEAFLLKTPPGLLLICGGLLGATVWRRRWGSLKGWFLALPIAVYLSVSIIGNLNIGHRHLTPIYPLLFVLAGGLPGLLAGVPWRRIGLGLLLAGYAVSFVVATPSYLSYFNLFAGGSRGGWRYLLDSNIDWGQDLPRLRNWMDRNGVPEIHLAYFGTADPAAYGIRYRKVYMIHDFDPSRPRSRPESGDYFAASINLLQGLYHEREGYLAEGLVRRGHVTRPQIQEWLDLRDRLSGEGRRHPELADWLVDQGVVTPDQVDRVESDLLVTWMREILETLDPIARAGDSIYIYRLP